jgi:hypothetical protein
VRLAGYTATGASAEARKNRSDGIRVDAETAWLRIAAGFLPAAGSVCKLPMLVRDKAKPVAPSGDGRRMPKSPVQMNMRVPGAVSDIAGATREGHSARPRGGRAGPQETRAIDARPSGHWRKEPWFSRQQARKMDNATQERIAAYAKREPADTGQASTGRAAGTNRAAHKEWPPGQLAPKSRSRADAAGLVPDERCGGHAHRCDGSRNGAVVLRAYGPDWSGFPTDRQIFAHATWAPHVPKSGSQPVSKKSGARAWPRAPYSETLGA